MDPFAALADPTRRRILELLAGGERSAGEITAAVRAETGMTASAVSQHLAVLRAAAVVTVKVDAQRRLYRSDPATLRFAAAWLDHVMPGFEQQLDALATEVARGRRDRRRAAATGTDRADPSASSSEARGA